MRSALDTVRLHAIEEAIRQERQLKRMGITPQMLREMERRKELYDLAITSRLLDEEFCTFQRERINGLTCRDFPAVDTAVKLANLSSLNALEKLHREQDVIGNLTGVSYAKWDDTVRQLQGTDIDTVVRSHLARISEISFLAQTSLSAVKSGAMGWAFKTGAGESLKKLLDNEFKFFSQSYRGLLESFEQSRANLYALPPILSELPAVELFNGANLIRVVSTEEPYYEDEYTEERAFLLEDIQEEVQDALEQLLSEFNPKLINMRKGAQLAIKSENPDRVRHFITSYRELFTHVLHGLSPDDKVRAWSTSKEHFDNNKPTRKARLQFICRNINQEPFDVFVEKDIEAALAAMNLFNRGTHEISSEYTPAQLAALETRMDCTLRFLLEIWRAEEKGH